MKEKDKAIRCLLDVVDLPPQSFAMAEDGRQKSHLSRQRKALVVILAKYANPDGTRCFPSAKTMATAMGLSARTVFRLLDDLRTLGFMNDGGYHAIHKTRIRALNVSKMTPVPSSPSTCDNLEPSPVPSSRGPVTSSQGPLTKQDVTLPPLLHRPSPPPPPTAVQTTTIPEVPEEVAEVLEERPTAIVDEEARVQELERRDEEAWAQHQEREWKRFLSLVHEKTDLRGAVMTRENAAAVRKQVERYDPETVVRAIQDWSRNRSMPVDEGLKLPWGAWLREGEPVLRKTSRTVCEERQRESWRKDIERTRPLWKTAENPLPRQEEFLARLEQVDPDARQGLRQAAFKEFSGRWCLPLHCLANRIEEWNKTGTLVDYAEE